jgi:carbamoyl-phosphate synthase small subunit
LNDNTCEGIQSNNCWSVQFHPEAAPGPMDANVLFDKVREMIDG